MVFVFELYEEIRLLAKHKADDEAQDETGKFTSQEDKAAEQKRNLGPPQASIYTFSTKPTWGFLGLIPGPSPNPS